MVDFPVAQRANLISSEIRFGKYTLKPRCPPSALEIYVPRSNRADDFYFTINPFRNRKRNRRRGGAEEIPCL